MLNLGLMGGDKRKYMKFRGALLDVVFGRFSPQLGHRDGETERNATSNTWPGRSRGTELGKAALVGKATWAVTWSLSSLAKS